MFIIYGAIGIIILLLLAFAGLMLYTTLTDITFHKSYKQITTFLLISLLFLPLLATLFRTTIPTYELVKELNDVFKSDAASFANNSNGIFNFFISLPYYLTSVWIGLEQFCPKIEFANIWWVLFVIEIAILITFCVLKEKKLNLTEERDRFYKKSAKEAEEYNKTVMRKGHIEITTEYNSSLDRLESSGRFVDDTKYKSATDPFGLDIFAYAASLILIPFTTVVISLSVTVIKILVLKLKK